MYFAEQMNKGDYVLLDNETIMLKVEMISTTTLTCRIERGGFLGSFKDVFVPNVVLNMPNYTEKDKLDIEMGIQNQVGVLFIINLITLLKRTDDIRIIGDYNNSSMWLDCDLSKVLLKSFSQFPLDFYHTGKLVLYKTKKKHKTYAIVDLVSPELHVFLDRRIRKQEKV